MKILITGKSNFLSKELYDYFGKTNEIIFISKSDNNSIDLTDLKQVKQFFQKHDKFDFVFHTAIKGGKRNIKDDISVLIDNLLMYQNLVYNCENFNYMFNFCSGAAFRDNIKKIQEVREEEIFDRNPLDYYGLSKNIISKDLKQLNNVYNFRIFGCFGIHEEETRLFKNILIKLKNNENPIIHQNKFMDYISAADLCRIIDFYIKNNNIKNLPKDINLVYSDKITLLDMCNVVLGFTESNLSCIVADKEFGTPYTGDNTKLQSLNIPLKGLNNSLMELKQHVFRDEKTNNS